jgi:hypothetical protein
MTEKSRQQEPEGKEGRNDSIGCPRQVSMPAKVAPSFHTCGQYDPIVVVVTAEVWNNPLTSLVSGGGVVTATLSSGQWKASFSNLPVPTDGKPYHLHVKFYEARDVLKSKLIQDIIVVASGGTDCSSGPPGGCGQG